MSSRSVLLAALAASPVVALGSVADAEVNWPIETFNRPLTMPSGTFQAGLNLSALPGVADDGDTALFDTFALTAIGGYGITDELEVLATYGFTLQEFEAKGTLRAGVGYAAVRGAVDGKLEIIARADAGYDFLGEQIAPITIGPQIQFNLTSNLAIISPSQFGNWLTITIDSTEGVDTKPIFLDLPLGLLYQATPNVFAQIDTKLASIEISDSDTTVIGDDYVLANVTGGYTPFNQLDVGVIASANVKELADTFAATIFFRYYGI